MLFLAMSMFSLLLEMCTALENPDNGVVMFESTGVGSSAQYACNEGFLVSGDEVRMCEAGGMWSGSEPVCEQGMLLYIVAFIGNGKGWCYYCMCKILSLSWWYPLSCIYYGMISQSTVVLCIIL